MAKGNKGGKKAKGQKGATPRTPSSRKHSTKLNINGKLRTLFRIESKLISQGSNTARLTLKDAARGEQRTSSFWDSTNKLRSRSIAFISGGTTGASFDVPSSHISALQGSQAPQNSDVKELIEPQHTAPGPVRPSSSPERSIQCRMERIALGNLRSPSDQIQEPSIQKPYPYLPQRPSSPALSDSSAEVIVFSGRNSKRKLLGKTEPVPIVPKESKDVAQRPKEVVGYPTRAYDSRERVTSNVAPNPETQLDQDVLEATGQGAYGEPIHKEGEAKASTTSINSDFREGDVSAKHIIDELLKDRQVLGTKTGFMPDRQATRRRGRKNRRGNRRTIAVHDDNASDEMLNDYIENMKANGIIEDLWEGESIGDGDSIDGWGPVELEDFADLSTSEEIMGEVSRVLSRRQRPSGLQYLVTWEGQSVDEARWTHKEPLLPSLRAQKLIEQFEERHEADIWNRRKMQETREQERPSEKFWIASDSDTGDDSDGIDEEGVWEEYDSDDEDLYTSDEEDLLERRKERMTDEHMARIFQKQEELGIHGDSLILFDQQDDTIGLDPFTTHLVQSKRKSKGGRGSRQERIRRELQKPVDSFENVLNDDHDGDDYRDFDVMDWERPSLAAATMKPNHRVPVFGTSEPDLSRLLTETWERDRAKKKTKKKEREELRAQGLLGGGHKKRKNVNSLRITNGLNMSEFEDELQRFLDNDKQQLALPPIDKRARKLVHEFANRSGLKSKSTGSGSSRFPTLYKTARTRQFNAHLFDVLSKRFGLGPPRAGGGGSRGRNGMGAGYARPGDVSEGQLVGAGAAEIGTNNKGHALLEKLGWTKGTALGATENKGIIMPVASVVKKGRTGIQ